MCFQELSACMLDGGLLWRNIVTFSRLLNVHYYSILLAMIVM
jgi:hypothetical protein